LYGTLTYAHHEKLHNFFCSFGSFHLTIFSCKLISRYIKALFVSDLDFVELHNGTIPDHQFNEAINGVFRQAKKDMRTAQDRAMGTSAKKQKIDHGQQTIDRMIRSKKSTSSVTNKTTTMSSSTIFDSDDDD